MFILHIRGTIFKAPPYSLIVFCFSCSQYVSTLLFFLGNLKLKSASPKIKSWVLIERMGRWSFNTVSVKWDSLASCGTGMPSSLPLIPPTAVEAVPHRLLLSAVSSSSAAGLPHTRQPQRSWSSSPAPVQPRVGRHGARARRRNPRTGIPRDHPTPSHPIPHVSKHWYSRDHHPLHSIPSLQRRTRKFTLNTDYTIKSKLIY
jgi:hypothetical protein